MNEWFKGKHFPHTHLAFTPPPPPGNIFHPLATPELVPYELGFIMKTDVTKYRISPPISPPHIGPSADKPTFSLTLVLLHV